MDYDPESHRDSWIHDLDKEVRSRLILYCPRCSNQRSSPEATMQRNTFWLTGAHLALFRLDGTFTVGTPIEIDHRLTDRPAGVAVWVDPPLATGLFVREFANRGAVLLFDREEALQWLQLASR